MGSWLYGLLLGLGIASGVLAFGCLLAGAPIVSISEEGEPLRIVGIVLLSLLPVLIIASAILISVCLSVGKI